MAVDCNFEEQHPVRLNYGLQIPSHTHVLLLNQLDDTVAILDKYRQSPFTRTFSDKKIRVTVIGLPDFTRHPEATSPEANTCFCGESYSTSWVQEQPLTLPKTSPIWWTLQS